jgi:hypothetical protein
VIIPVTLELPGGRKLPEDKKVKHYILEVKTENERFGEKT